MVIWLRRTARVSWIISVIQVFKFIGFVYVIRAIRVIITLNEYSKEREAPSECKELWGVCNFSAHFAGENCTYSCRPRRSHGLRRGAHRCQGCPGHHNKLGYSLDLLQLVMDVKIVILYSN